VRATPSDPDGGGDLAWPLDTSSSSVSVEKPRAVSAASVKLFRPRAPGPECAAAVVVQIGHGGFPRGLGASARMNRDGFGELCAEANLGNDPHQGSDEPDPDGSWNGSEVSKGCRQAGRQRCERVRHRPQGLIRPMVSVDSSRVAFMFRTPPNYVGTRVHGGSKPAPRGRDTVGALSILAGGVRLRCSGRSWLTTCEPGGLQSKLSSPPAINT
jgi:hypothetical protein